MQSCTAGLTFSDHSAKIVAGWTAEYMWQSQIIPTHFIYITLFNTFLPEFQLRAVLIHT